MRKSVFNINAPGYILNICNTLEDHGYPAYVVGGCIRDTMMHNKPKDWDVTTTATPDEIEALFKVSPLQNAKAHGVSFVHSGKDTGDVEVATFRRDGQYDGHNCIVDINNVDIHEDLARRDFTINAMAYRPATDELFDDHNGIADINNRIIKCVGNAADRVQEDPLRILRGVRFCSKYGFEIDGDTYSAMQSFGQNISHISKERQRDEFVKILLSDDVSHAVNVLYEIGALQVMMPEFCNEFGCKQNNPNHIYDVAQHTLHAVSAAPKDEVTRIALFLHDYGKMETKCEGYDGFDHFVGHAEASAVYAKKFMTDFRFTAKETDDVCTLVRYHDAEFSRDKTIRKFANKYGYDVFRRLGDVRRADIMAQSKEYQSDKINRLNDCLTRANELEAYVPSFSVKDLAINGYDVMNLHVKDEKVGEVLRHCYDAVCEDPALNTREQLLRLSDDYLHPDSIPMAAGFVRETAKRNNTFIADRENTTIDYSMGGKL